MPTIGDAYDSPRSDGRRRTPRKRLLIVTEGQVTEKIYFDRLKAYLELTKPQLDVKVIPSARGSTPSRVVQSAKELKVAAEKLQRQQDKLGSLTARAKYDQVWVVFDTESYAKNVDLKPAAASAKSAGLHVAISRPCFESWFLLHLRDGLPSMECGADVIREISAETKRRFSRSYKKNQNLDWLLDAILPATADAIRHGTMVARTVFCDHDLVPSHSGTMVHKLVDVLWKASRKGARGATGR